MFLQIKKKLLDAKSLIKVPKTGMLKPTIELDKSQFSLPLLFLLFLLGCVPGRIRNPANRWLSSSKPPELQKMILDTLERSRIRGYHQSLRGHNETAEVSWVGQMPVEFMQYPRIFFSKLPAVLTHLHFETYFSGILIFCLLFVWWNLVQCKQRKEGIPAGRTVPFSSTEKISCGATPIKFCSGEKYTEKAVPPSV